jgi:hypothetical protein
MAALTQQGVSAIAGRDASGFTAVLLAPRASIAHQLGPARLDQLSHELWNQLRRTPAGIWLGGSDEDARLPSRKSPGDVSDGIVPPAGPERATRSRRTRRAARRRSRHRPPSAQDPQPSYETPEERPPIPRRRSR